MLVPVEQQSVWCVGVGGCGGGRILVPWLVCCTQ
jgi:hypothetical protein